MNVTNGKQNATVTGTSAGYAWGAGIFLVAMLALGIHAWQHLPFISDDAFISLRYADRLLHGDGLTWASGPRVEGYSNLLWVLACAALGKLGVDLIDAARIWGFIGMGAALAAIAFAFRPRGLRDSLPTMVACGGLVFAAPIIIWTIGGLEQPFVAGGLAWALAGFIPLIESDTPKWKSALWSSLALGLLCLTRSDGGVLCVGVALGLLAGRGFNRRTVQLILSLAVFPLLLGGGQVLFRLAYYGEWLPNPAHVKVAFTSERVRDGWAYVTAAVPYLAGLLVPAVFSIILGTALPETRRRTLLFAIPMITWLSYVVIIGGDIFPAHRHWVPGLVCAAFLIAEITQWGIQQGRGISRAAWLAACLAIGFTAARQGADPEVKRAIEERWEWDGQVVGNLLIGAFGKSQPLVACDPAGCIPYFSRMDSIDMMGLNDYHIARARGAQFGRGVLGHELGDGDYVLGRKPDIVIWTLPTGANVPLFPSARQMDANPEFHRNYRFVILQSGPPRNLLAGIWVRMDSEKIGIRTEGGRIVIPGMFAASSDKTPAILDGDGLMGVVIQEQQPALLGGFGPPPGRWKVRALADAPARVVVREAGGSAIVAQGINEAALPAIGQSPAFFDLSFAPLVGKTSLLRRIILEPVQ